MSGAEPAARPYSSRPSNTDRGVEGGDLALSRRVTVPPAVVELLAQQSPREVLIGMSKVGAEGKHAAVDARFLLAFEEGVGARRSAQPRRPHVPAAAVVAPAQVGFGTGERRLDCRVCRISAGCAQELQGEQGRQPRGSVGSPPCTVLLLESEDGCAQPFARNATALHCNGSGGSIGEVVHRLPADGGVRIEEKVERVHGEQS